MSAYKATIISLLTLLSTAIALIALPDLHGHSIQKNDDKKNEKQPKPQSHHVEAAVEIVATVDKAVATLGEKVRLTELIPRSRDGVVGVIGHTVYLIAEYDSTKDIFVNLYPEYYQWRRPSDDFNDLPLTSVAFGAHGWQFDIFNPRQKGIEVEFTPLHLGVFQIMARWSIHKEARWLQSCPVILMVQPPVDEKGKRIVKPEWLIKN